MTTEPSTPDRAGAVIGERYRLDELLGEGGMGAVYRAEHLLMKKTVAVKLLHPELGRVEEAARRFEREAQSASRLSHPGIIQVTDFGRTDDGVLFLVMEYLFGEPVSAVLARQGRLPVARALEIMRQVLSALAHAHAQGVVHRDLKPDNIMLTRRADPRGPDAVKILDFGIAKLSDGAAAGEKLTQAGVVFGTPWYMSPEQALGEETDARSDLYSCGVILYELVTGARPYVAEQLVQVISMHLTAEPRPPRELAPELPEHVERTVLRAMAKSREDRFKSAAEFLAALEGSLEIAVARPSSIFAVATTEQARHRKLTLTVDLDEIRGRARAFWARLSPRGRRAFLGGTIGATLLLLLALILALRGPARPARPDAALAAALRPADEAMARGDLVAARAVLMQQLSQHADAAAVHDRLGNLAFLERRADEGLDAYREAIRLDRGYANDPVVLRNAQAALEDKRLAAKALHFLIESVGEPAGPTLALVATHDRRPELRHEALSACDKLGCRKQIDLVQSYLLDLGQEKRCEDRREVVLKLKALGDKRALDALRKAKGKSGGFFSVFGAGNECMKTELDEAIEALSK